MGRAVSRWSLAAGEPIRVRGDDTGTSLIGELRVHLSEILPRFSTIIIIYMLFVPGGRVGEDWETPIKQCSIRNRVIVWTAKCLYTS